MKITDLAAVAEIINAQLRVLIRYEAHEIGAQRG